jgi:hypothetical protein
MYYPHLLSALNGPAWLPSSLHPNSHRTNAIQIECPSITLASYVLSMDLLGFPHLCIPIHTGQMLFKLSIPPLPSMDLPAFPHLCITIHAGRVLFKLSVSKTPSITLTSFLPSIDLLGFPHLCILIHAGHMLFELSIPLLPSPLFCPQWTCVSFVIFASQFTQDKCYST